MVLGSSSRIHAITVVAISLFFYTIFIAIEIFNSLGGQFDEYLQPGAMYAAPAVIKDHGYDAHIYIEPGHPGWDGQFYYYMANDPIIVGDTPLHIDWQRIVTRESVSRSSLLLYRASLDKLGFHRNSIF